MERPTGLTDQEVPWWAVALLDIPPKTDRSRVRQLVQRGYARKILESDALTAVWSEVVAAAVAVANRSTIEEWVVRAPEVCRFAALESPRAFVQFCNILDDTLKVPILKDFHVRACRMMREQQECEVLLPFGFGKSWISSMLVPFMDWAEDPEFTQGRVYFNRDFARYYATKLMAEIDRNARMTALFPWIRRPVKPNPRRGIVGDPCHGLWSTRGFSIGGKQAVEFSFEPLTVSAGATGKRYWRAGVDDWVNSDNSASEVVQTKMWDYFHTGPKTMGRVVPSWRSHHGTRAGTLFTVGTLFHRQDINYRLMVKYRKEGLPVMRQDCYSTKDCTESIWPEERPISYIESQRRSLGPVAFNMRMRNRVTETGEEHFEEERVDAAFKRGELWAFGEAPPEWKLLIGFDPASGKRTRASKFPAAVVVAFTEDRMHVVEWGRWSYPQPKQVQLLGQWAKKFGCTVYVEDASQQISYRYWMEQQFPNVRVKTHTTKENKRDWNQGVESLIPYFQSGNITFHTRDAPHHLVEAFREELVNYPQGRYTDLVMALWVAKYQYELGQRWDGALGTQRPLVTRGRGMYTVIDLKSLRERRGLLG